MQILGIDEAGRGPVIGPLVMSGVMIEEDKIELLEKIGVKDSKLLSPKQRNQMYEEIIKIVEHKKLIIQPKEIDNAVTSQKTNLNWLEAENTARIINHLKPQRSYVDCPSNNVNAYKLYLRNLLEIETDLVVEHKADQKWIVVGAASIIAKVTRDNEIENLKKKFGDFGSGYPSDPKTKEFLKENHGKYPEIFRKSWQTYKDVAKKQILLFDFEEK